MQPLVRDFCDLFVKALVWNVWLIRNDIIFNANTVPVHAIILKVDHMLLSLFSNCTDNFKGKLKEPMKSISRSLEFIGSQSEGTPSDGVLDVASAEEAQLMPTE